MELPTLFFEKHPNPMLIFDTDTLEILAVNESAVKKYGFTEKEFTQLTIEDIRPAEDISELRDQLQELEDDESKIFDIGTWRHRTKDGTILYVQIATQGFPVKGRNARIVHVHDVTEIVKLKEEIGEAYEEQRYHIENNPLAMVKYDHNFRVIEWSKRAVEKTGYTKEEVLGSTAFEISLFADDEVSKIRERMSTLASGEKDKDRFETVIYLKNGKPMDVMVHASALRNKEGGLKSVLAFIENISVRKEYERELVKREMKYHRLFEDANDGIFLMDGEKFIDCNHRIAEIFGRKKEKLIGKTPLDFSPAYQPDGTLSSEKAKEKIREVQEGNPQVFEWIHLKKTNGQEEVEVPVEISLNTIELDEHNYLQAIVRDLTDQKQTQRELRRHKEWFESLFVDAPIAIAMINTDGRVRQVNNSFSELFGYSNKELAGKDLLEHQLPEERYDEIPELYQDVFSGERSSKYYEDQRVTKDGEVKDLLVGALPVTIDEETIGAFGIYTDITDLRETEEKLQHSLKEKEILLSEIHHRVKNNLAIISGLLLLEAMNWEEGGEVYQALMQSKHRIHSMAKIHEQLYESNDFSTVKLENYIEELVTTIRESMKGAKRDVEIEVDCDEISLNINQALPSTLIINELITNAFKYAFEEDRSGKILVKFKQEEDLITIIVQDDGPGLPTQFEEMAEQSLGHQLVNQLVKQLKGEIRVKSSQKKGTRYEIRFKKKERSGSSSNYFG
ncbi:PAS domain S-box protein [Fodinibius halophilus]|uniref:histidine kinase n=1 Tax=Fodinibius halophilus TaxID=1736908 RepID=A0A6M1T7F6_9BACT|nr:PAS domain S-box protein [Fodinibius halophilus]NGP90039.1 PAS domain S-box protein [Fodinibius halophilus]